MTEHDEENFEVNQFDNDQKTDHGIGICQRFRSELRADFFSLEESSGRYIDVADSFAPASPRFHHVLLLRAGILVLSIISLALSLYYEENYFMWLGYLTNLGLVISIAYQITACIVTFRRKYLTQPNADFHDELSIPMKIMWFLYVWSVPNELIITLLFWALDYPVKEDKSLRFDTFTNHGIIALLLLIDGNLIARIPLRIKNIVVMEIYSILYLIWTVIHAISGIGNGTNEGDLLYEVIDWKNKPIATLITSVLIVVVVVPIMFMLAWLLSLIGKGFTFAGGRRQLHAY